MSILWFATISIYMIVNEILQLNTANKEVKGVLKVVFWSSITVLIICLFFINRNNEMKKLKKQKELTQSTLHQYFKTEDGRGLANFEVETQFS